MYCLFNLPIKIVCIFMDNKLFNSIKLTKTDFFHQVRKYITFL